jgi:transposase
MGRRGLPIDEALSPEELRRLAVRERSGRTARRMLAIANALDGMSRADAAAAAGMDRQALRDAVVRYNAEGLAGLVDRPGSGRPPALAEGEVALLAERIFKGPDPEADGVSSWTLEDLCAFVDRRFAKRITPQSLSRILRREGFSRQKVRPVHPKASREAAARFEKRGSAAH